MLKNKWHKLNKKYKPLLKTKLPW